MPRHRLGPALLAAALLAGVVLSAQDVSSPAQAKVPRRTRRDPPGTFMGRRIAPVMSFEGADWLVRATRERQEQPEAMLNALKIAPDRPWPTSARGSAT